MTYEEARTFADLREKDLVGETGDVPVTFNPVEVVHLDGSTFYYEHGLLEAHGKFLMVFSEHHHPDVFFLGDLERWGFVDRKKRI